jgi:DNA-binding response OmpR family regulator
MPVQSKILVADDSRMTREWLRMILTHADYEVILAEDGASAIEMATTERPDLVITDGLLPKVHGFLACKAIKQLNPAPKVILLTGIYTKPTYKWEIIEEYHADDVLTKPAKPADLLACIEKHLNGQARLNGHRQTAIPEEIKVEPRSFGESEARTPSSSGVPFGETEMNDFNQGIAICVA